jgi:hypothetical protein
MHRKMQATGDLIQLIDLFGIQGWETGTGTPPAGVKKPNPKA